MTIVEYVMADDNTCTTLPSILQDVRRGNVSPGTGKCKVE